MTETIRTERILLKKFAKRKTINHNDPVITKAPYLIQDLQNKGLVKIVSKKESHIRLITITPFLLKESTILKNGIKKLKAFYLEAFSFPLLYLF